MLRREFPKALMASAAGAVLAPPQAQAQAGSSSLYEQTPAEISAGVMPADRTYPPLHVLRYGGNPQPGVTDMTSAITTALSLAASSHGAVYAPAQAYRITGPIVVPPGVTLYGDGPDSTFIEHHIDSAGAVAVTLGDSDTRTSYGCVLRNLCIRMHLGHTSAMKLRATIGAWIENVQLLGDGHAFSHTGCIIQGGSSVGCFFNVLQNVYAEHFHIGFHFLDLGTPATNQIFVNCSAFGDYSYGDKSSVGALFAPAAAQNSGVSGESSVWLGGDFENCAIGVSLSARTEYTQWFGARFEGNALDVDFGTNTTGTARNVFFGPTNSFNFKGSLRPDNGYYLGPYCSGVHVSRGAGGLGTNIAIGNSALTLGNISTGGNNVALGVGALAEQKTGAHCVAVGNSTLAATSASDNTAVGQSAGAAVSSGAQNTLHGASAGNALTSGSRNTALGCNAQCGISGDGNIAIGFNAGTASSPHMLSGSHQAVFGDSSLANAYLQVPWTTAADSRDTTEVTPLGSCLDAVCALRPVSLRTIDRHAVAEAADSAHKQRQLHAGFIAQDVASALREHGFDPDLVVDASDPERLGLTYARLIPFLASGIADLASQLRSLKNELDTLHSARKPAA
jgi:Pectate lyase superfamily protein/Chaperone of endosialidase